MRKTLLLTAVVILAVGLMFAWAEEQKPAVDATPFPTTAATLGERAVVDPAIAQVLEEKRNREAYEAEIQAEKAEKLAKEQDLTAQEQSKIAREKAAIAGQLTKKQIHFSNLDLIKANGEVREPIIVFEDNCAEDSVQIEILTDSYPSETSWKLVSHDDTTIVVASGAPSGENTLNTWQICVDSDSCYDFMVYDSWGDGIYSPGYASVFLNNNLVGTITGSFSRAIVPNVGTGCPIPTGACCVEGDCVGTNTEEECDLAGGSWYINEDCSDFICPPLVDWDCTSNPPPGKTGGDDIDTPSEPGNDVYTGAATAMIDYAYCGALDGRDSSDTDDWYSITLPSGPDDYYCLIVRVYADDSPYQYAYGDSLDPYLYIYADDGTTELYADDDYNGEWPDAVHWDSQYSCEISDNCFPAGTTLYIRIGAFTSRHGPYLLVTGAEACALPTGACCYGDPTSPDCIADVTEETCLADPYNGYSWVEDGTCPDACPAILQGDNCALPFIITLDGSDSYTDTRDLSLYTDDYNWGGEDVIYEFTPDSTIDLVVTTCNSPVEFDDYLRLQLAADCGTGTYILNADYGCDTGDHGEFHYTFVGGTTYVIMVDSWSFTTPGQYTLDIYPYVTPTGRCCYYDEIPPDLYDPLCDSPITETECDALIDTFSGFWTEGLDCTNDPCPLPPANDDCEDALAVGPGDYNVDNTVASTDGQGIHNIYKNVWFCYTATMDGVAIIELCDSDFDTKLAVYDGCSCDTLGEELAYNDDDNLTYCTTDNNQSAVAIEIENGHSYLIEAGNYSSSESAGGLLALTITEYPPCIVECPEGANIDDEPICYDDYDDITNPGCNGEPPAFGTITDDETLCGTAGVYIYGTSTYRDMDWFEVTIENREMLHIEGKAEFNYAIWVMKPGPEGEECDSKITLAYGSASPCTTLTLDSVLVEAGTYWIVAAPADWGDWECGSTYYLTVSNFTAPPAPSNDLCDDALDVGTLPATQYGSTVLAWYDEGLESCGGYAITAPGVWYHVAGNGNDLTASLCLTDTADYYDSRLHVFAGTCADPICVDGDDDGCDAPVGLMSEVTWCSEVGLDYLILVSGFSSNVGDFRLDVTEGDACTPAIGRCCYGEYYNYTCVDDITEYVCFSDYDGSSWMEGGNCTDNPCPTDPHCVLDPTSMEGSVEDAGPGNSDAGIIAMSNDGTATLDFTASVSIDPPPVAAGLQQPDPTVSGISNSKGLKSHQDDESNGLPFEPGAALDFTGSETFDTNIGEFTNYSLDGSTYNWEWSGTYGNPVGSAHHGWTTSATEDDYLVSNGSYTVPDTDNVALLWDQMDTFSYDSWYVLHEVLVSTDFAGDPGSATWTQLYEDDAATTWETVGASLEAFRGQNVNIAFHYGGYNGDHWYVDNVDVTTYIFPIGRCCDYSDPSDPVCTDVTHAECMGDNMEWTETLDCATESCAPHPDCPDDGVMYSQYATTESYGYTSDIEVIKRYDNYGGAFGTIEGIRFWGVHGYYDGLSWAECSEIPMDIEIGFYEDDAGLPGATVYTETFTLTPNADTWYDLNGWVVYEYDATFTTPFALSEGWVSIQGVSDPATCWFLNTISELGDGASVYDDGGTWYTTAVDLAFCLTGIYEAPWLQIDTESGTINPGDPAVNIGVTMDAEFLECNDNPYTGSINFSTNDPNNAGMSVPVSFYVCAPQGYQYVPGDANMGVGAWKPTVIGGDVTYLVGYFRGINPPCLIGGFFCSGDANGDCLVIGSDVTKMVTYFRGLTSLAFCPDYPPVWPTPGDCPDTAPAGWPNCEIPTTAGKVLPSGQTK